VSILLKVTTAGVPTLHPIHGCEHRSA
jgi:hypothetical protein